MISVISHLDATIHAHTDNNIDDEGIIALAPSLAHLTNLTQLNLNGKYPLYCRTSSWLVITTPPAHLTGSAITMLSDL